MTTPFDIPEMLEEIIKRIDQPKAFLSALRVNKEWNKIASSLIPLKKKEFIQERERVDSNGYKHIMKTYPNGTRHGKEEIYTIDDILIGAINWMDGIKHGFEKQYDGEDTLVKMIPWKNGIKNGKQVTFLDNNHKAILVWEDGKKVKKTYLNQHNSPIMENHYSSNHSYVRYHRNGNSQLIRDGVFVGSQKHGIYNVNGKDVLYIHGVEQLWYTDDYYEMAIYIGAIILTLYLLYQCYKGITIRPLLTFAPILSFLLIMLIVPFFSGFYRGARLLFKKD